MRQGERNFEAVLGLMASGSLDASALISHRFTIENASSAYEVLGKENPLGIVIEYPGAGERSIDRSVLLSPVGKLHDPAKPAVAMIGAGNYANNL